YTVFRKLFSVISTTEGQINKYTKRPIPNIKVNKLLNLNPSFRIIFTPLVKKVPTVKMGIVKIKIVNRAAIIIKGIIISCCTKMTTKIIPKLNRKLRKLPPNHIVCGRLILKNKKSRPEAKAKALKK